MNFSKVPLVGVWWSKLWRLVNYTFSQRNPTCSVFTKCWYFFNTVHLRIAETPYSLLLHSTNYMHEYFISPYTVRILIIECRMWYIPYLEILADGVTALFTHQIIQQTHVISIVHVHVLLWKLLKNVNRPKLIMMTGRNGLYFLLRLGRLSYAIGLQSETL